MSEPPLPPPPPPLLPPPPGPAPAGGGFTPLLAESLPVPDSGTAQRLLESLLLAAATSTGLYLVGSVYVDAYYARMSVDATSLDLSPTYIALQSMHVLPGLLEYPLTVGLLYALYRILGRYLHRARSVYAWVRQTFGRLFLLLLNLIIVSPLLLSAVRSMLDPLTMMSQSVVSEVNELMQLFGILTFAYVLWLSFSARRDILSEIRKRKWAPIVLLGALYLLDTLIASAHGAGQDAEWLMTGLSSSSLAITLDDPDGDLAALADKDLLLVIARGDIIYVVEKQPMPPSTRPVSWLIPRDEMAYARVQRVVPTDQELLTEDIFTATPAAP
ncbi:MAG: hypothetical protein QM692_21670 [Thermomicrobiales bacterium]